MTDEDKMNPAAALAQSIPDTLAPSAPIAPTAPRLQSAPSEQPLRLTLNDAEDEPAKKTRRSPTRSTASIGASKELKGVLPTNERLHVYKRSGTGEFGYCADYSTNEVTGFGTIEAFIRKFVVPHYGYGEYQLYLQKGGSPLSEAGKVTVVQPIDESKNGSDVAKLKDILEATQKMAHDAKNEGASAFDGVAKLMTVMKDMRGEENGKGGGMDAFQLMMLMQMMQKPEAKKDHFGEALLRRLEDIETRLKAPPPMPMPMPQLPPPPPPPDPMASLAPILAGFMETMGKFAEAASRREPAPPARDVLAEIVQMKTLFEQRNDSFGAKEIIGLLPTLKDLIAPQAQGAQSLEEQLTELRHTRTMLRELEGEFRPEGGERSGGFWENIVPMLGMLLGRQDMASNVAQGIASAQRPAPQLAAGQQNDEEAEEPTTQIPAGFKPFAETINDESKPIAQKIGALIMGMQFLVKYESFRPAIMAIFDRLRANDRKKALSLFEAFLGAFIEAGIIEQKPASAVFEGIQVHWDVIRQRMGFPDAQPRPPKRPVAEVPHAKTTPEPAAVSSIVEVAPEPPSDPEPEPELSELDAEAAEDEDSGDEVELDEESYEAGVRAEA
jgi:hypothetical protein